MNSPLRCSNQTKAIRFCQNCPIHSVAIWFLKGNLKFPRLPDILIRSNIESKLFQSNWFTRLYWAAANVQNTTSKMIHLEYDFLATICYRIINQTRQTSGHENRSAELLWYRTRIRIVFLSLISLKWQLRHILFFSLRVESNGFAIRRGDSRFDGYGQLYFTT